MGILFSSDRGKAIYRTFQPIVYDRRDAATAGAEDIRLFNHRWPPGESIAVLEIEAVPSHPRCVCIPCPLNLATPLADFSRGEMGHTRSWCGHGGIITA